MIESLRFFLISVIMAILFQAMAFPTAEAEDASSVQAWKIVQSRPYRAAARIGAPASASVAKNSRETVFSPEFQRWLETFPMRLQAILTESSPRLKTAYLEKAGESR